MIDIEDVESLAVCGRTASTGVELDVMVEARAMGWAATTVGAVTVITHREKLVAVVVLVDAQEDAPVGRLGAGTRGGSSALLVDTPHASLDGALRARLSPRFLPAAPP